jgi:1-acyl-sn-glycerol-3-phosphate acyltransferase
MLSGDDASRLDPLRRPVAATSRPAASHPDPREESLPRRAARLACLGLLRRLFALTVEGIEQLPARGPYLLAANHHNYLDGVVLAAAIPRPVAFLVMPRVYRATPLHPWLHGLIGSIPLDVERPDPRAIRRALETLARGRVVGIFPEGPHSHEGRLVPGQPGAALLALRAGVPVVPVGIHGTFQALAGRPLRLPRRHPLRVRFGAPIRFDGPGSRWVSRAERARALARIMEGIAALLGPEPPAAALGCAHPAPWEAGAAP